MKKLLFSVLISILPFLLLFFDTKTIQNPWWILGHVAGYVTGVLIVWQTLLGIRAIARWYSSDIATLLKTHMYLGIYSTFGLLLHPFLQLLARQEAFSFLFKLDWSSEYAMRVSFGRIALACGLVVIISSGIARKNISFRNWKRLHFLSFPLGFFTFIHAYHIGTFLQTHTLLWFYWTFWFSLFICAIIYRTLHMIYTMRMPIVVVKRSDIAQDILTITCRVSESHTKPRIGQFAYIKTSWLSESHPFSVVQCDPATNEITFCMSIYGPFTQYLYKHIHIGDVLYLDGYYGIYTQVGQNVDESRVIIAGGVGITPFVDFITQYGNEETYLLYANKTHSHVLFDELLHAKLQDRYNLCLSREHKSESSVINRGPISADVICDSIPEHIRKKAQWYVCGSPRFMAYITHMLDSIAVPRARIQTEVFDL